VKKILAGTALLAASITDAQAAVERLSRNIRCTI
jgi:hypothetical protein